MNQHNCQTSEPSKSGGNQLKENIKSRTQQEEWWDHQKTSIFFILLFKISIVWLKLKSGTESCMLFYYDFMNEIVLFLLDQ